MRQKIKSVRKYVFNVFNAMNNAHRLLITTPSIVLTQDQQGSLTADAWEFLTSNITKAELE